MALTRIFDRPAGPNSLLGSDLLGSDLSHSSAQPCRIRRRFCIRRSSGIFHILFGVPANHRDTLRNGQYASELIAAAFARRCKRL